MINIAALFVLENVLFDGDCVCVKAIVLRVFDNVTILFCFY